jgi:twitching motility protein PilT
MAQIDQFLRVLAEQGGSDLHLTTGSPPLMRLHGHLQPFKFRELSAKDMETLVYEIMEEDWRMRFLDTMDFDFAYEIEGLARFRVNVFWQRKGLGAVFRTIPSRSSPPTTWGFPRPSGTSACSRRGSCWSPGPRGRGSPRRSPPWWT